MSGYEDHLQSRSSPVERLSKPLERINASHERPYGHASAGEQFDRTRERTASRSDHGDLVDDDWRERDRRLAVEGRLDHERAARANERNCRLKPGSLAGCVDGNVELP